MLSQYRSITIYDSLLLREISELHACDTTVENRTALVLAVTKTPSRTMKSAKPGGSGNNRLRKVTCSKAGYHSVQEHATSSCADIWMARFF